jgi:hypothetical protein
MRRVPCPFAARWIDAPDLGGWTTTQNRGLACQLGRGARQAGTGFPSALGAILGLPVRVATIGEGWRSEAPRVEHEPLLAHADELAGLATTLLMEAHLNYLGGRLSV